MFLNWLRAALVGVGGSNFIGYSTVRSPEFKAQHFEVRTSHPGVYMYIYIYICICICIYIYIYIYIYTHGLSHPRDALQRFEDPMVGVSFSRLTLCKPLHSAKGGAVETGCSGLYDVMY